MGLWTRERVRRRELPVGSSIHWKPLRDSHYIVASLEPGQGGRRQLRIKQNVLIRIHALARHAQEQYVPGLLVGGRFECPVTGTSYVLVEALVEAAPALDERALARTISALLAQRRDQSPFEAIGWYCGAPFVEARPTPTQETIHLASFPEPWQTMLVVSASGDAGAFFLRDAVASRWFQSPFFEEVEPVRGRRTAKPSAVAWQQYLTMDAVAPLPAPEPAPAPPPLRAPPRAFTRSPVLAPVREPAKAPVPAPVPAPVASPLPPLTRTPIQPPVPPVVQATVPSPVQPPVRASHPPPAPSARPTAARRPHRPLPRMASAGPSVSRATRLWLGRASSRVGRAAARGAPIVRASVTSAAKSAGNGASAVLVAVTSVAKSAAKLTPVVLRYTSAAAKSAANRASAMARVSFGLLARARATSARLVEREIARRAAAARARQAAAALAAATASAKSESRRATAPIALVAEPSARPPRKFAAKPAVTRTTDQPTAPAAAPQAADLEDTTAWDPPFRFLALAAREGFGIIAKPETGRSDHSEFWVLEEPDSGFVLTVTTSDLRVLEAILHYNLRTEDDLLLQGTPPEHRDLDSRTIYVRESAVEHLRARCRYLRANEGLVREWKVSPPIDLPHPGLRSGNRPATARKSETLRTPFSR